MVNLPSLTSRHPKPKPREWIDGYFIQCAAYACMLYELTGITVKKFVILMACENGECEVYEEYDKSKYIKLLVQYIREFVEHKLEAMEKELKKALEDKFYCPSRFTGD